LSGADHPEREQHAAMNRLMSELDERQRRLYAATEAKRLGRGGIAQVQRITGISRKSLRRGMDELAGKVPPPPPGRVRALGAGRFTAEEKQPGIREALAELVEAETAGDPEGQGRWVRVSLRELSNQLAARDYSASHQTVSRMLGDMKYRLRVNAKRKAGPAHPDRDQQFEYIEAQKADFRASGDPIISVDTKKKNSLATSRTPAGPGGAKPRP
jgi:hypothetical protein